MPRQVCNIPGVKPYWSQARIARFIAKQNGQVQVPAADIKPVEPVALTPNQVAIEEYDAPLKAEIDSWFSEEVWWPTGYDRSVDRDIHVFIEFWYGARMLLDHRVVGVTEFYANAVRARHMGIRHIISPIGMIDEDCNIIVHDPAQAIDVDDLTPPDLVADDGIEPRPYFAPPRPVTSSPTSNTSASVSQQHTSSEAERDLCAEAAERRMEEERSFGGQ